MLKFFLMSKYFFLFAFTFLFFINKNFQQEKLQINVFELCLKTIHKTIKVFVFFPLVPQLPKPLS